MHRRTVRHILGTLPLASLLMVTPLALVAQGRQLPTDEPSVRKGMDNIKSWNAWTLEQQVGQFARPRVDRRSQLVEILAGIAHHIVRFDAGQRADPFQALGLITRLQTEKIAARSGYQTFEIAGFKRTQALAIAQCSTAPCDADMQTRTARIT